MTKYKCSFKAFVRNIGGLEFFENIRRKIQATPFGHYLDFEGSLAVDSSLLDNSCGRWESGNVFSFVPMLGRRIEMSCEEVSRILNIPWRGWKID